jgi:hypothetical protein
MKTLYIDTNILGCEEDWKQITALGRSMPTFRVIVSDWHMVELTGGADRIQAARRACFIDSLRPLWMRGYLQLQMCEIERFVWQHYYGRPCEEPWIFTEHLSAVWADYLGSETVIGLNAKRWAVINRNLEIRAEKIKILEALNTLQTASQKQKRQIESEVFPRWILARISDVDPDKKTITQCQK